MKRKLFKRTVSLIIALIFTISLMPLNFLTAQAEDGLVTEVFNVEEKTWTETITPVHNPICSASAPSDIDDRTYLALIAKYPTDFSQQLSPFSNLGGYEGYTDTGWSEQRLYYNFFSKGGEPTKINISIDANFFEMEAEQEYIANPVSTFSASSKFEWSGELNYEKLEQNGDALAYGYTVFAVTDHQSGISWKFPACSDCLMQNIRIIPGAGIVSFRIAPMVYYANSINGAIETRIDYSSSKPFITSEVSTPPQANIAGVVTGMSGTVTAELKEHIPPAIEAASRMIYLGMPIPEAGLVDGVLVKSGATGEAFIGYEGNYPGTVEIIKTYHLSNTNEETEVVYIGALGDGIYIQRIKATDGINNSSSIVERIVKVVKIDTPPPYIFAKNFAYPTGENPLTVDIAKHLANVHVLLDETGTVLVELKDIKMDENDLSYINDAIEAGIIGNFELYFSYDAPSVATSVIIYVILTNNSAGIVNPSMPVNGTDFIGGNDFAYGKNQKTLTSEIAKQLAIVTAKDKFGVEIELSDIIADPADLEDINNAISDVNTKPGEKFPLHFTTPDGTKLKVTVEIKSMGSEQVDGYDQISANDFSYGISSGHLSEEVAKHLADVYATTGTGIPIKWETTGLLDADLLTPINEDIDNKVAGTIHDLTFKTVDEFGFTVSTVTIKVTLTDEGSAIDKNQPSTDYIAANHFEHDVKSGAITADIAKELASVAAVDSNGKPIFVENIIVDSTELEKINNMVATGANDEFSLTFKTASGVEVTISVTLTGTLPAPSGVPGATDKLDKEYHNAYIIGYPDGTFLPNNKISRAEAGTVFFRLLKDDVRDENMRIENSFSDVIRGNWYNTAVSTMFGLEIITGYPNGTFVGEGNITRAEFAAMCARFSDENPDGGMIFSDVDGHWAEKYIIQAAALGWINGYEDGTFKPNEYITRAEAVTLVNRMLNRLPETKDDLHTDMVSFTDNQNTDMWYYLAIQEASNSHRYVKRNGGLERWTEVIDSPDWSRYE